MTIKDALEKCEALCVGAENAIGVLGESAPGELTAISDAGDAIRAAIKSLESLPPDHHLRDDDAFRVLDASRTDFVPIPTPAPPHSRDD
jgi:hypothetical protein